MENLGIRPLDGAGIIIILCSPIAMRGLPLRVALIITLVYSVLRAASVSIRNGKGAAARRRALSSKMDRSNFECRMRNICSAQGAFVSILTIWRFAVFPEC